MGYTPASQTVGLLGTAEHPVVGRTLISLHQDQSNKQVEATLTVALQRREGLEGAVAEENQGQVIFQGLKRYRLISCGANAGKDRL